MKTTIRRLSDIANLHDLRSISRTRRSAKPQLSTTAIMELSMARNERDRLVRERPRLVKRKIQIDQRLTEIDREMDELFEMAREKAVELRGKSGISAELGGEKKSSARPKMTLEY